MAAAQPLRNAPKLERLKAILRTDADDAAARPVLALAAAQDDRADRHREHNAAVVADAGAYRVVVSNAWGIVTSAVANVTVTGEAGSAVSSKTT